MFFDKHFNLIFDINDDVETCVKPITRKFFEKYYKIFSELAGRFNNQVNSDECLLYDKTPILDLKDIAGEEKSREIIDEIVRITLISCSKSQKVKEPIPIDIALKKNILDEDDYSKALNVIVFFTVLLLIIPNKDEQGLNSFLKQALIRSTSLPYTDYLKSSEISKKEEITGRKTKIFSL